MRPIAALSILLALSAHAADRHPYTAVVSSVVDGDTVWVRPAGRATTVEIRLQGIDAPETCQTWGPQSRDALRQHLLGHEVTVQERARDGYGRHLALLARDGQDVGAWMVSRGLAWSPRWRGRRGPYDALQLQAMQARRGLWSQPRPLEPRRFRQQHGACPHRAGVAAPAATIAPMRAIAFVPLPSHVAAHAAEVA